MKRASKIGLATLAVGLSAGVVALAVTSGPSTGGNAQAHHALPPLDSDSAARACTRHVAPSGDDSAEGTQQAPWQTLSESFDRLRPGDVLCVRDGTYEAPRLTVPSGTAAARITVRADAGAAPVVEGSTSLVNPMHWTIRDLTWSGSDGREPVVTLLAGTGWVFESNEVTDGSYAGLLVGKSREHGNPHDYSIRGNVIHDTKASNLYLNPGRQSRGGLVERNLLFDSETQNLKLGWGGTGACTGEQFADFGIGEVTVRYNTLHDSSQPLTVAEPGGDLPVSAYRNIITGGTRGFAVRLDSGGGCLSDNVQIFDNLADGGDAFVEDFGQASSIESQMEGNVFPRDPRFDRVDVGGFRPRDAVAEEYGHHAP